MKGGTLAQSNNPTTFTYELRAAACVRVFVVARLSRWCRSCSRISIRCVFACGDAPRPHRIVSIVYLLLNYYLYRFRRPRKTTETTFVYFCT